MLFRRRQPAGWSERLRLMLWPRRSFRRSVLYLTKRIMRIAATPHAVALGVAIGVFVTFIPVPGLHIVLAVALAWPMAGNLVASALGTAIGNPLTFPFIWGATYELGQAILRFGEPGAAAPIELGHAMLDFRLAELWEPLLKPMVVGGLPLGVLFSLVSYVLTRWAVARFQGRRAPRRSMAGGSARDAGTAAAPRT